MHAKLDIDSNALIHETGSLLLRDGSELFFRAWHPGMPRPRAVILFHGGHEHSGRFDELVARLGLGDTSVFAWDARGHGRSPGERGYARHFMELVCDADEFVRHVSARYGIAMEEMVVMGHSVGSVIAATWVHDYAPPVRGMLLGSPAFNVKLYAPLALPALRLWQRLRPHSFVNSYVRPGMLTHDIDEAEARRHDPLISPQIAVPVLTSLFETAERVIEGAGSIRVPTLVLSAGRDRVVHTSAHRRFVERLGAERKELKQFPGFYHEIFHETGRHQAINYARSFIRGCFAETPPRITAEANRETFAALSHPLGSGDPRRLGYALARAGMASVGRLSDGIRLGFDSGFDSGRTLDYVYANRPHGVTALGRTLDRAYLESAGWRGIRQRGEHLQQLLIEEIARRRAEGQAVAIVDLASGPGRYLLEVLAALADDGVQAVCRDRDVAGLMQGEQAAAQRGIRGVRFEQGDAFDPASIASLEPRPDIVVVSGLYELFEDNAMLRRSLAAIAERLPAGGSLIVTNQPRHPQLAFIARTLPNRDGARWVMRPRSQAEMHGLLREAGFTPAGMLTDDDGIFTVTVARKGA